MIARDGCENRGLWAGESCGRGGGEDRAHSLEGQLEGKVSIGMLDREGVEVLSHRERSWLFFRFKGRWWRARQGLANECQGRSHQVPYPRRFTFSNPKAIISDSLHEL